jgi:hypothetical protein
MMATLYLLFNIHYLYVNMIYNAFTFRVLEDLPLLAIPLSTA